MSHRPRKRFGQNFLHDRKVIERIVGEVELRPDDHVLEIGPGRGALTGALADRCARLDCIEVDRDLCADLRLTFADAAHVTIHEGDALRFDFEQLARAGGSRALRVVANLPYNISTPILFHLLESTTVFEDMHLMLQHEVVERMVALPGSRDYGRLSVMIAYHCEAERLLTVPPGAFVPQPKVTSAVVRLRPRARTGAEIPNTADPARFAAIVAQAFSQRRKTLRNSLRAWVSADTMEAIGIAPTRRPETLCVEEFLRLAEAQAHE